jgi:hypothetical protein
MAPNSIPQNFTEDIKYKTMTKLGITCKESSGLNGNIQGGYNARNTAYGWLYHWKAHLGTIMNRKCLHFMIYMVRRYKMQQTHMASPQKAAILSQPLIIDQCGALVR